MKSDDAVSRMQTITLYEQDFYAWTQQQVEILRSGQFKELDLQNLISEARSKSWWATIREQRQEIELLLKENPSLKPYLTEVVAFGYTQGINLVVRETPLYPDQLPQTCPFSTVEIFDEPVELE
jgi:hypothetical protein